VVHKGIKLADRLASKAPALIPPGAKLEDLIVPVENIELVSGEWLTHSLLLPGPDGLSSIGSEFQVFMPLEIGGATRNYTFVFKILGAE
jgi:hypothetical protein